MESVEKVLGSATEMCYTVVYLRIFLFFMALSLSECAGGARQCHLSCFNANL